MASVSVSHLILFIASMIIAAGVAGVFTTSVDNLSEAISDRGVQVSDNVRTSIEIISDSGSDNVFDSTTNTTTIYVKNTGSKQLNPVGSQIDVLVDGRFKTGNNLNITVASNGNPDAWDTNDVIEITIDGYLDPGDHRVLVIANGDEETFEFRVEDNA
ncbi:flagellar protein FlaG [Halovenus aranensis]|jgi:flagellar protein FlaG|uniref:Flagellar protein FlaG n=1 Tax=Halovenus aranensis TaxID=890420 RepID=A0A1G8RPZ0_9EURY|nr:flagellar protein G [Halovenus aranensis]SDJ18460.1 flagellar protein FlaG [Halovenus aranensis]